MLTPLIKYKWFGVCLVSPQLLDMSLTAYKGYDKEELQNTLSIDLLCLGLIHFINLDRCFSALPRGEQI